MITGARILISGGSGGIGGAIARQCGRRGAWPIVGYCSGHERATETVRRCGTGEICRIDLRDATVSAPPCDALVHCAAAFSPARSLLESSEQLATELLEVNVLGALRLTRAAAASKRLTRVVFVLSSASFCRGTGPYALSKAAELALCRLLANELAPRGVRVDGVVPGWTDTPMARQAAQHDGRAIEHVAAEHPQGRILDPDDVGRLCASLLFDQSDAPPGQLIEWDLRGGADPVWQPLHPMLAAENAPIKIG
jgi:3-oxoacyl-[acyl-carrier protein] reductase